MPPKLLHRAHGEEFHASGSIHVIAGCMFAGKTSALIDALTRAMNSRGMNLSDRGAVAVLKHASDDRYDASQLVTHDGVKLACQPVADCDALYAAAQPGGVTADVVGIDEVHFFGRGVISVVRGLAEQGARVICAGIDHDAWGQPFTPLPELKQLASEVTQLTARCSMCGQPAKFSQRLVPVTTVTMVGGDAEYAPRCTEHFEPLPPPRPVY